MTNKTIKIALAGNPNSGKTTTFNSLTGARQHVGNYPGVTVERKEGTCFHRGYRIEVVDLPGTYSLTAYSAEEIITRKVILQERPDVLIDIIDASNLERNLYLAVQLLELGIPLILALNMIDVARVRGFNTDVEHLSALLGVPVIPTVASNKEGMEQLLETVCRLKEGELEYRPARIYYGGEIEEEIEKLHELLAQDTGLSSRYPLRWLAVKLLENDSEVIKLILTRPQAQQFMSVAQKSRSHLRSIFGDEVETVITDRRYGFIEGAYHESTQVTPSERVYTSDLIDKVLTHRLLSFPIFFALMWLVYQLTFIVSEAPTRWIEQGVGWLGVLVGNWLPESLFRSLLVDGIIAGVGNVLVLLPPIMMLFLAIAILEDSGYMARVAFIMDKIMHKMGLHGKSVIPMIIGFGCGVPAIMATRTLASRRDRLITMLIIPLMSCSARLPVYAMFIEAFFSGRQAGNVLFSIYLLGMVMAVLMARLFRRFLFPGPSSPFVMELPPYRLPTLNGLAIHMWDRARVYLKKAGTLILAASIIIWFLGRFPRSGRILQEYEAKKQQVQAQFAHRLAETAPGEPAYQELSREKQEKLQALRQKEAAEISRYTMAGYIGRGLVPFLRPLGLGDWKVGMALFSGFVAKEVVISSFGTLYQLGEAEGQTVALRQAIRRDPIFSPLSAYTLMVFVLLYVPCMSTMAVLRRESGGWGWPLFAIFYTTALAWGMSFLVYQGGSLLLGL